MLFSENLYFGILIVTCHECIDEKKSVKYEHPKYFNLWFISGWHNRDIFLTKIFTTLVSYLLLNI